MKREKIVILSGPTATGKSNIGIYIAEKLNGEIIYADSMVVYKGMDIGTDKPGKKMQKRIKHHLIDIVEPNKNFSVALNQKLAREAVGEISKKGKIPVVLGGTGLYIRALIDPLEFPGGNIDSGKRKELEKIAEEKGAEFLYKKLKEIDKEAAENIHPSNVRRIIRALEVIEETGDKYSERVKNWQKRESIYDISFFGLILDRDILYKRINKRVEDMVEEGLIEEAKEFFKNEVAFTPKQALGYKESLMFFNEEINKEELIELVKRRTRNFAKRQMIWLRKEPRINWIDANNKSVEEIGEEIVSQIKYKED